MSRQKNLKRNLLICLLAGSAVMYTLPLHAATSVVANNALPNFDKVMSGALEKNPVISNNGLTMDITQTSHNAVIKWNSFNVGGSATVNFWGPDKHNTLNYVNSANMSQIYGTINANNNGNIFIVNPAGVQIGPSAQINVGSLYVSNSRLSDDALKAVEANNKNFDFNAYMNNNGTHTDAALMSLGNINATNVTFEGDGRIVIDSERIKNDANNATFRVNTNDAGNVVIGYDAYNEVIYNEDGTIKKDKGTYDGKDKNFTGNVFVNGTNPSEAVKGYMWVEDVEQLQAINTNLGGNYALRNSIDATSTAQGTGFNPIGLDDNGKVVVHDGNKYGFTGKFDGIDYNIFGLNINQPDETNVGLFGVAHDANINNVTLVGGSITGGSVVGSVVGAALGNTHITNATNSASVTGNTDVGGIVGYSGDEISDGDNGNIIVNDTDSHFANLVNTGTVHSKGEESNENGGIVSNAGGLIGYMYNGKLDGNSYNLGDVSGKGYNVGGLVGHAVNSTIGDGTNLVYNRLDVEGAYNVGGIVGNMKGTAVQNAENSGNVLATGYRTEDYIYHTGETNKSNIPNNGSLNNGVVSVNVNVANVGGIAGKADDTVKADGTVDKKSEIKNVTNSGNVSSSKQAGNDYYDAGNVGGIVGSAVDTNITNATNKENEVRGAHNVGGVAGYFGNSNVNNNIKYTINRGINDGGDIMATGARKGSSFVTEIIRPVNKNQTEKFIIGNIGGIAGYMDGDNVYITGSGNRGTVHTDEPGDPTNVGAWQKAANVGGIVGKIDRSDTKKLDTDNNIVDDDGNLAQAAVSDSYNTGDVLGYTGIGGIAGLMYNGEIASSYNLGYLRSTRQSHVGPATGTTEVVDALNMGGIVGDTTEESNAKALLYDVYNKGQIGDKEFNYFGRHVGGVVGRLSGTVEKAYNTGAIYNGYNVVGGIAGWVAAGTIQNAFNTGNITVYNQNESTSQVGGIAGAANGGGNVLINNVYNLGTLRSFDIGYGKNAVAGILGTASGKGTVTIKNAYTTGNLYSGVKSSDNSFVEDMDIIDADKGINRKVSSMYASTEWSANVDASHNTYYIKPAYENGQPLFTELTGDRNNANKAIDFTDKDNSKNYEFDGGITSPDKTTGVVVENSAWRIYGGNTPILNAFLPKAEDYFSGETGKENAMDGIGSIQYGTAYDPLLTIIKANGQKDNLSYSWEDLGINNAAGIAVYGAGLTLGDFKATGGSGYFGGTIYADGALNINGTENINIGSAADIYGSAVNITTDGKVTIYGDVTATGNATNGVDDSEMNVQDAGDITINAGDVDVYGKLTSASDTKGATVTIPGIEGSAVTWKPGTIDDPYESMADIADRFAHTTGESKVDGNITINAGTKLVVDKNGKPVLDENGKEQYTNIGDGNVNLYYGNKGEGLITTGGDLTVTGRGNVYVDSDLDIAGNVTLTSTGKDGEVLLTLTNIGKVQADRFMDVVESAINGVNLNNVSKDELRDTIFNAVNASGVDNSFTKKDAEIVAKYLIGKDTNKVQVLEQLNNDVAVEYMHDFMHSFDKTTDNYIALNAASGNAKLTVDMWVENSDGSGKFDFAKYDSNFTGTGDGHTFIKELEALEFYINEEDVGNNDKIADASKHVYVEVHNGEQLKGIQDYVDSNVENASDALKFNYALMGDINASDVENYEAIGTGSEFTGTFDGRGNRIIGLNVNATDKVNNKTNAGIFSTIGNGGTVKNVNIYSGNFTGTETAGAVAGTNNGRIENVTGFGNTVTSNGNAGGIVGENNGNKGNIITNEDGTITLEPAENEQFATGIIDVESIGSVIAKGDNAVAGGLVGTNDGALGNSYSESAVTSTFVNNQAGLGGVVGVNTEKGNVQYVDSLGVTNGGTTGSSNVGGVIGINKGNMYSGYNESIVSGKDNVGGIIGTNSSAVGNVVNATSVSGKDETDISEYVGGLVGTNSGSVTNGRNNGTITGTNYVGGMVGNNADRSTLTNLVNDSSAAITGVQYVGGIAGKNDGIITANNSNLINRGSITGNQYVGGVAGMNTGKISNTVNSVVLNATGTDAKYFGGVAGYNNGVIGTVTNTSVIDVTAQYGTLVGGIIGFNDANGTLAGEIVNEGNISGESEVGGIIGENINQSILNNEGKPRLTISNKGNVRATNGGAAGIFYDNQGVINNVDLINEGTVTGGTAKDSVTGGLFGKNSGKVTNSILTNSGIVTGGGTVGGLIGDNSGSASGSVFTNDGIVEGEDKVGGLFGINSGSFNTSSLINTVNAQVTGKQEVGGLIGKNTGKIEGGRDANDSYYKYQIYNNGTITGTGSGSNIGGLIGNNADETSTGGKKGILTAGYNTGVINAENSTNVGGIAGINAGTIGEVFNTVYNTNGTNGAITGGTNVGGLVGTNSGTLSNAYNTTAVSGNANVGNAVGVNDGTNAKAEFVYDVTNTGNKLIGENINSASVKNSYTSAKDEATADGTNGITYISADKSKNKDSYKNFADGTWKFYDGNSNPLLKVFLTNLTVNDSVEIDGKQVTLNEYLKFVYDADEQDLDIADLIEKGFITAPNKELLEAYKNTLKDQSNGLGESYLLDNTDGQVDAGTYDNWLYSDQIASGSTDGSFNPNNLGYDITFENKNNITIDKATINIDLNDIYHTYGDINNVYSDNDRNNHASYEDSYTINNWNELDKALQDYIKEHLQVSFNDDDAINGNKTQSVGDYDWSLDFTLDGDKASNYQIGNGGQISNVKVTGTDKSHVEKAKIAIGANNEEIHLGETPDYTGTDINGVLVNGDSLNGDYNYGIAAGSTVENEVGRHENVIGVWIDGTFYDLSGNVDWTKVDGFFANYDITVKPGTLTVTEQLLPDIPQDWPHNRWDYLFTDAPFDRNKDFRERKAEVNFVDGGMEI